MSTVVYSLDYPVAIYTLVFNTWFKTCPSLHGIHMPDLKNQNGKVNLVTECKF